MFGTWKACEGGWEACCDCEEQGQGVVGGRTDVDASGNRFNGDGGRGRLRPACRGRAKRGSLEAPENQREGHAIICVSVGTQSAKVNQNRDYTCGAARREREGRERGGGEGRVRMALVARIAA